MSAFGGKGDMANFMSRRSNTARGRQSLAARLPFSRLTQEAEGAGDLTFDLITPVLLQCLPQSAAAAPRRRDIVDSFHHRNGYH